MVRGLENRLCSRIIEEVSRPGRYFDHEINFPQKQDAPLRFLLCFPDLYDIGMSNIGVRVLYHVLNRHPDILADLAFTPWVDMETYMKAGGMALAGLGTGIPAKDFAILGFSLQHELQYTNVLTMLYLAGIPLRARDRDADDPVVIAGGPCAFNPEPMSDFIDAFAVGDGETVSVEIALTVLKARSGGAGRREILTALGGVEGVYVPAVHDGATGLSIRRRVEELGEEDFPLPPIVPIIPITHDRLTIEIMRGCTRGCRFCSAGMLTRPVRQREVDSIVRLAEQGIDGSGWEEVSLVSLSTSDYADLATLVRGLNGRLAARQVSISLPSMRPGTFSEEIATLIGKTKKTGLTFAPEAGSARLRDVINKGIDEDELYTTVETAFSRGWNAIKLYFMIGLPTETDEDAEALVKMVRCVEAICRVYGRRNRITVSLSPFVPRPHTPFQWEAQQQPEEALRRISYIRKSLPDRRVKLKWRDPYMAQVEGLLASGDSGLGRVILGAWQAGSRFDAWTDQFDFDLWRRCFDAEGIDVESVFEKKDISQSLPWDHIGGGVSKDFLIDEARRATLGVLTPDCRTGQCSECGACPGPTPGVRARKLQTDAIFELRPQKEEADIRIRFRVRFAKTEPMILASHLDVARCIQRGLRRAGVPLCYSRGFSPHPRVSFGPPLPLGVLGESEYLDVFFSRPPEDGWIEQVNSCLPGGVRLLEARMIPLRGPSLVTLIDVARYSVIVWKDAGLETAAIVDGMRSAAAAGCEILEMTNEEDGDRMVVELTARLVADSRRPEKVFGEVLKKANTYYRITRKELLVEREGELRSPLQIENQED